MIYNVPMSGFGELLRSRREAQGLEQAELARMLGVTQQTVSKWETGVTVPRPARVSTLARVLELDAGLLHSAAADEDDDGPSSDGRRDDVPAGIRLDRLSRDELVKLLDAAWRELTQRRRQTGAANQASRR